MSENGTTEQEKPADGEASAVDALVSLQPQTWICPACQNEITMDNTVEWCGKNLRCTGCKDFYYYSEYIVKAN